MAPAIKMTEYERQRMENIRRNDEMMAALKLQHRAAELTAASKRQKYLSLFWRGPFHSELVIFIRLKAFDPDF